MTSSSSSSSSPGRKHMPLPRRTRNHSVDSRNTTSQSSSESSDITPDSASVTAQPLEDVFQFGQNGHTESVEQHDITTFRGLHNVTPLPTEQTSPTPPSTRASPSLPTFSVPEPKTPESTSSSSGSTASQSVFSQSQSPKSPIQTPSQSPSSNVQSPNVFDSPISNESPYSPITPQNQTTDTYKPYDVRDEETPEGQFFEAKFQRALKEGLGIAKTTATMVESWIDSTSSDDMLKKLLKDAKDLSTFHSSDSRTIAVLGDSGEGKSSLINSLLHFPEIARTGDIGAACTSVVTEYRQKTAACTAPITIEVEYLGTTEIEELITELLWSYRQLYLPDAESDDVTAKEYERRQRESEQAWSALEAAFKHQDEFTQEWLQDMSEGALGRINNKLIRWSKEIEWPADGEDGLWRSTAEDAEECCEKTSIFMQDRFWPFTKIIRVYLDAQVLKTGVILADLPGLQDTNLARVRATQMYLVKCDFVFIVAKISRAITDRSLKSSLFGVISRHVPLEWEESAGKSLNLAVVCTKSEDINEVTARREFCGPNKAIEESVMEQLDSDIKRAKNSGNRALKQQLKRRQQFLLVEARNRHVKQGLQQAYAAKVPGGNLQVFCISNTTYEKYSRKGNIEMVKASGIPELRQFCHSITAEAQFLQARHFLQSRLSTLLNSLELWASTPIERPAVGNFVQDDEIYNEVERYKEQANRSARQWRRDFNRAFKDHLQTYIGRKGATWTRSAEMQGEDWCGWHWTQYSAWCSNHGNHATAKRSHRDWNAEIIQKMRFDLAYQWQTLEGGIPTTFGTLVQRLKDILVGLTSYFQEIELNPTFTEGIVFRAQDIEYRLGRFQRDFSLDFRTINHMSSESTHSSYILRDMTPHYRKAAIQSGTGKSARQKGIVQGHISSGSVFRHISEMIMGDLDKLVEVTYDRIYNKIDPIFKGIENDLKMTLRNGKLLLGPPEGRDYEEEERRRKRVATYFSVVKKRHDDLLSSIPEYLSK